MKGAMAIIFLLFTILTAEIQQVTLSWREGTCDEECGALLKKKLIARPAIQSVKIDSAASIADIRWHPRTEFNFKDINRASRVAGIRVADIVVKARGTISHRGKKYFLSSIGDDTEFQLLSNPLDSEVEQIETKNIRSYKLTREVIRQLNTYEKDETLVTISGPLFQPLRHRNPPAIVIRQIKD